ncbi:unnamed protein product (macronuclear) [Paramecium tetraurelia]|uniref:DNA/RNA-binding protein Alba-like domain-containing protein n=1 Tax=Paramecium tetraurelia TaxID=5888 RepID=A0DIW9_PARTE|nr:uncharacterized protein GSPATT00017343001 [Paramecium tetraurelia]CAK82986.1 unnamed protein product [Paramecium tetraurelia]|eukprot:XP_001450383.1 hypothetical protein (macronuclear) [Paramecium tetraurelia strain d4-2]
MSKKERKDFFDIMIKTKSSQDQIASYLVQAILGLRDRENKSESIRLSGSGSAIPNVILVAEIIRARHKGLSSIVTLENIQKEILENGSKSIISIPAIRIKLTCNPTKEEQEQPGYQAPGDVKDDKKIELYDYIMIYARNLYFWKGKEGQKQTYNQPQKRTDQQIEERGELKTRGGAQVQVGKKNPEELRRKPDEPEYREKHEQENRDKRYSKPKPITYQSKQYSSQDKEGQFRPKQGEVRTRGGNRR